MINGRFLQPQNISISFQSLYMKLIYKATSLEIKQREYIILCTIIHRFIYIYIHSQEFLHKTATILFTEIDLCTQYAELQEMSISFTHHK